MTLPGFGTVVGPAGLDYADGATGYNLVSQVTEENLDRWNAWLTKAQESFAPQMPLNGASLVTPATGWAFDTYSYRASWGRKWAGVTFLSMSFLRTGATVASTANGGGAVADTTVASLAVGWRPLRTFYVSGCYSSYSPCQLYINTSGSIHLYTMSEEGIPFLTNRTVQMCALFPNTDVAPYP